MTDPLDTNDEWADLAREFKLDKPPAAPADMVERIVEEEAVEPHLGTDARVEETAIAEGETEAEAAEDEFEDAEDAPAGEAGADGEQPGTGRKRRRRRRRRRKGAPTEGAAAEGADAESAPEAEGDEEPTAEPVADVADFDATEDEDTDGEPVPLAADEDTASDVLRELIATWNVPSWGEIVDGLYRPN